MITINLSHLNNYSFADDNATSINITELLPNQTYIFWIQASTTETLHNQSHPLKITTPQYLRLNQSVNIDSHNGSHDTYANDRPYILIAVIGTATIVIIAVIFNFIFYGECMEI